MDVSDPFDMIQSHYLSQDMGPCWASGERLRFFYILRLSSIGSLESQSRTAY